MKITREANEAKWTQMKERIFKENMPASMDAFLEARPDWVNMEEALAKCCGAEEPRVDIARVLLQRGASASHLDPSQLAVLVSALVCELGDEDILRLLLMRRRPAVLPESEEYFRDPEGFKNCGDALRSAAERGLKDIVKILAKCGCPLDERAANGITAMHQAARNGHEQVMLVLHKYGCIIDGPGEGDRTPACEAALNGHTVTLQVMKDEMGCDLTVGEGYDMKAVP